MPYTSCKLEATARPQNERLPYDWEQFGAVIDDGAILGGSMAEWGYRLSNGSTGQIFFYPGSYGKPCILEVHPLDGTDRPVAVEINDFRYTDPEILRAIDAAYLALAQEQTAAA